MTAPDHVVEPLKTFLREWGHPYMPFVSGRRQTPPDLVGEVLAELERPLPHALVAHDDAARGQHLLDHAQAAEAPVPGAACDGHRQTRQLQRGEAGGHAGRRASAA